MLAMVPRIRVDSAQPGGNPDGRRSQSIDLRGGKGRGPLFSRVKKFEGEDEFLALNRGSWGSS